MNAPARQMTIAEQVCRTLGSPEMRDRFATALPSSDPKFADRFTRVVITAVQQNPALLADNIERQSLYNACVNAAKDGLLPDGREGALVPFKGKVQWMPMVAGIIKRIAESGMSISAQIVYSGDVFERELGDDAKIIHKPPALGADRGNPVGVYAIARDLKTGVVIDREVMDMVQIDQVKAVSRSADSGPWVSWPGEMARKTVIRRLAKRLPITDASVYDTLARDNDLYDLDKTPVAVQTQPALPAPVAEVPAKPGRTKAASRILDQEPPPTSESHEVSLD